jgi:hypothetical protein
VAAEKNGIICSQPNTDQDAPFNPTYILPSVPVSSPPLPGSVTPTVTSWSLRIERELTPTNLSTRSVRLSGTRLITRVISPPACRTHPSSLGLTASPRRPNRPSLWSTRGPNFSGGDSAYNASQVDLRHRFGGGLTAAGSIRIEVALVSLRIVEWRAQCVRQQLVFYRNFLCPVDHYVFDYAVPRFQLQAQPLDGSED